MRDQGWQYALRAQGIELRRGDVHVLAYVNPVVLANLDGNNLAYAHREARHNLARHPGVDYDDTVSVVFTHREMRGAMLAEGVPDYPTPMEQPAEATVLVAYWIHPDNRDTPEETP